MNFKSIVAILLAVMLAIATGCGGKKTVYPDSPATATGISDAEGAANIDVGPYNVIVNVVNIYEQPVAGINISVYLLKDHLLAVASDANGNYYSNLGLVSYEDAQSNSKPGLYPYSKGVNSAQAAAGTEIEITIVVENAGLASNGFEVEPAHMDVLETDEWINVTSDDYDMSGFYALAGTVDFSGGTFVHLTSDVSYSTGAGRQTAIFLVNKIADAATFSSLMGLELRIFSGDTLHTRQLNYMDNLMPILIIDDIIMHRDFWMQFTLTWAENPSDLDSHLWTPIIEGDSYHIYFASRGDSANAPYVDLDVDDVTSYGPEHITIYDEYPGTYTYAIYHYAGSGDISMSEAEVGILEPDGTVEAFTVPEAAASANWWWHVCTIDGTTGEITPVNNISADPPLPFALPGNMAKVNAN